ncbi:TPA: hypothetical protein ACHS1L_005290 [Klebsiella pneumoniae]|nr:hypothetical protein [Klebsiella pneumoniae]
MQDSNHASKVDFFASKVDFCLMVTLCLQQAYKTKKIPHADFKLIGELIRFKIPTALRLVNTSLNLILKNPIYSPFSDNRQTLNRGIPLGFRFSD